MAHLSKIIVNSAELGESFCLSPEYWLAAKQLKGLGPGVSLEKIAIVSRVGVSTFRENALILDTGHADGGLFSLSLQASNGRDRVSHKKRAPEGAVIISRLRPYLRQVAYIPKGFCDLVGVSEVLCSTEFYVLLPSDSKSIAFLVPWLLSEPVQDVFQQASTGGHHPRFDEELLTNLAVPKIVLEKRAQVSRRVEQLVTAHLEAQVGMQKLCMASK